MEVSLRRCVCLVAVLLLPVRLLSAQTVHPCDVTTAPAAQIRANVVHKLAFCQPATDAIEDVVLYVTNFNGSPLTRTISPMSAPSTTGQVLYETPKDLTFPVGNYVLEAATRNREYAGGPLQEGAKSGPFSFAAVLFNPMPSAPTIRGLLP